MKLILTREVSGLGTPGDVVDVKDGYGRNYLIPQRFATPWTRGGQKQVDAIKRARSAREVRDADHAREIAAQLEAVQVTVTARVGSGGRLFGSITPSEIADAVERAGGPKLDKRRLELPGTIKAVGTHKVSIKLHQDVEPHFTVNVVAAK